MQNVVIEFLGICGSGKTYLCDELKTMLQSRNIDVYNRTDLYNQRKPNKVKKLFSGIKILLTPAYFILYMDLLFTARKETNKKNSLNYLTKILLQQEYLTRRLKQEESGVYLIDEGFTHLQWTFIGDSSDNRQNKVKKYLNRLYKKYKNAKFILLCIDGDAELSYQRIENREQGWPNCFPKEANKESKLHDLHNYLSEYEIILSLLPEGVKTQHISAAFDDSDIELYFRYIMENIVNPKEGM